MYNWYKTNCVRENDPLRVQEETGRIRMEQATLKKIITAGFDDKICIRYADAMHAANGRTAHLLALCGIAVSVIMMAHTFLQSVNEWGAMPFYLVVLLGMLLCTFVPDRKNEASRGTKWMYLTVTMIYMTTALHSLLVAPDRRCVAFCLVLAVLPSLILDAAWRTLLPGMLTAAAYIPLYMTMDMGKPVLRNAVDIIVSFIIGGALACFHLTDHARELTLRDNITGERDTDALTKAMRRGPAEERIRNILENDALPCVMMMVDVDNFKGVNDTYGHSYGDKVLEELASLLRRSFRCSDVVCRIGGDEFMVFVVGAPEGDWLRDKTDKIIQYLATTPVPGRKDLYVSISMGAVRSPQYGTEFDKLFVKADHALYEAKRAGKNRCCIFGEEEAKDSNTAGKKAAESKATV